MIWCTLYWIDNERERDEHLVNFCFLSAYSTVTTDSWGSSSCHNFIIVVMWRLVVVMRSTEHWWSLPVYTERRFVQGAVGVYRVRVAKSNAPFASVLLHVVTPTTTIPCDCCSSVRHLVPIVVSTVVNRSSCLLLVSRAPTNRRHPFFVSATCEREPSVPCCFRARDYCSVGVQDFLELSIHLRLR